MFVRERGFKGQFTIVSLITIFIMLLIFAKLYPVMQPFIAELIGTTDEMTALMVSLVPFLIATAIIMSILWYVVPRR
jgi:hypothetical protein